MKRLVPVLLALALTGCGGAREHGTATLWVTQDRGAHVLYTGTVPAGQTAMQALEGKQKITTRYGGRFVQSIDGVQGSASSEHDWFYFVDGIEASRGATEVTLHPGDVEWWDYRSWKGSAMSVPVVLGSYPQPFVRGTTSVVPVGAARSVAMKIARQVRGVVASKTPTTNYIVISTHFPSSTARIKQFRKGALLDLGVSAAQRLARNPAAFRFQYGVAQ